MKKILISETDLEYRKGLANILIGEGAVAFAFEVDDDFDVNSYEGLIDYKADVEKPAENFSSKYPEIVAWIENYRGNFDFYLSLQLQFRQKGMLSEKQMASIQKAIARDQAYGIATPEGKKQEFSLKAGTVLIISKFIANKISQQAGYNRGHRAIEVIEVEGETEKAFRLKVRLSARRTSHCGICGQSLENPISVANGIGPICAERADISYSQQSLDQLAIALSSTVEVVTWIPKKSIKEKVEPTKEI